MKHATAEAVRRRFLKFFAAGDSAAEACRRAGVPRSSIETRRRKDPVFRAEYAAAMAHARARLERVGVIYDAEIGGWRLREPDGRLMPPNRS